MSLTERISKAVAAPATDGGFDPHAELADVLTGVGLDPADSGDRVSFRGADPVVPSPRRLGGASAIALADRNGSPADPTRRALAFRWVERTDCSPQ
ncbi:hypothetical protein [Saccharopolyspora pogona]|uniref:hypothetical protein n=1 Tax=Saccharopolyspora pogona TaxID=333966 RepID=UPI00168618D0|nr:hypothetical protein [Saccharopolyspora pogona]